MNSLLNDRAEVKVSYSFSFWGFTLQWAHTIMYITEKGEKFSLKRIFSLPAFQKSPTCSWQPRRRRSGSRFITWGSSVSIESSRNKSYRYVPAEPEKQRSVDSPLDLVKLDQITPCWLVLPLPFSKCLYALAWKKKRRLEVMPFTRNQMDIWVISSVCERRCFSAHSLKITKVLKTAFRNWFVAK